MTTGGGTGVERDALVVRSGALGDVLLLRRAIATLRAAGFRVTLVAPGPAGAALIGRGGSEATACLDSERADLATLWARDAPPPAALSGRALAYAVSGDTTLAANLSRLAPRVVTCAPAPPPAVHASDWLARPLRGIGLAPPAALPDLEFTPAETEDARPWRERLPQRFLALHPGSGSPKKNWPHYAGLARALSPREPFLVVCGPADREAAAALRREPHAVVAQDLPVRTLGALLARAGAFVGNDSGVAHLSAASGTPTLALFGPTDPAQWAPVGRAVRTLRAEPIGALDVTRVADAAATLWEQRGPRSR